MLYTIPDYYKEFHCIADKCEDTCCAGWKIVIDDKSLVKYKKISGSFRWNMLRHVNWIDGTFRQDKNKRCAFLNEKNLCELYLNQGESSLCKTCTRYPRHIEEFEGVREISLSISCPEAARILMSRKKPVTFLSYERDGIEEFEDFDPFLFSILEDARKEMIKVLQNRELGIRQRVLLVLGMAHDMQGRINRQELFDCFSVIEKYRSQNAEIYTKEYAISDIIVKKRVDFSFIRKEYSRLYELELLRKEWDILLQESEELLYGNGETVYEENLASYQKWSETDTDILIHLEQLLVYFLFTYLPGAVYDGLLYAKVQMAVYCTWMIYELWMARFLRNDKSLDLEEMINLVYLFSREVEHSDQNLEYIEKMMKKPWR